MVNEISESLKKIADIKDVSVARTILYTMVEISIDKPLTTEMINKILAIF